MNRQGIGGLRIEAWDKDMIFNDLLGSATTDTQGKFLIVFDESRFKELFGDDSLDLFIRVFQEGVLIKSTEESVLWNVKDEQTESIIEVDMDV
jgi:DNA replication protein DnaC